MSSLIEHAAILSASCGCWSVGTAVELLPSHSSRRNTFNGKLYKNDPAIMGWGLFNEPRCPASQEQGNGCPELVGRWHNEMTKFAKAQNTKQLVRIKC